RDADDPDATQVQDLLLDEHEAARYTDRALAGIAGAGCTGALLWCYADYARSIWGEPPLDLSVHERHFGLWRSDGSAKPAVATLARRRNAKRSTGPGPAWIDLRPEDFYMTPLSNLTRLYERYRTRG